MMNLTNAQLIEILSKRNPDEPVVIMPDYNNCSGDFAYPELCEHSDYASVHYAEKDDRLVINIGYWD